MPHRPSNDHRVVITGIGVVTSIGHSREAVWQAIQRGDCGVRRLTGVPGIPDGLMLGATGRRRRRIPGPAQEHSALPAVGGRGAGRRPHPFSAASIATASVARSAPTWATRIMSSSGCGLQDQLIPPGKQPWWQQWLPNTACAMVAQRLRPARPAAEQFDGLRQRHDRDPESGPGDSRRPVRPGAGRQLRSDPSAVRRRLLQHGRACRSRRSRRRPAGRST